MRRRRGECAWVLLILLTVGAAACRHAEPPAHVADPSSRRSTVSGEVVGFQDAHGGQAWLGIPYAAPPVGALRWRAPQPPGGWSGVREALAFGSPCTQYASAFAGVNTAKPGTPVGSEDCLYANVYAPRFAGDQVPKGSARLPVMVWIHGGGNSIGEAGFYDGGHLAVAENVIIVSINYRLGPFGWFRHAALRGEGATPEDRSGNFGTLDTMRALQWVRDNISGFGGDPNNVTVFGESAGGTNVYMLLLAAGAHGLFERAIVESGGLSMSSLAEAEDLDDTQPGHRNSSNEVLLTLFVRDGMAADRTAAQAHLAAMSPVQVEQYLRGKSNFEILAAYTPMPGAGMIDMPKVFAEGVVLPEGDPLQHLTQGDYNQVPVIVGTNRDENKLFMFADPRWVRRIFWVVPRLRDEQRYNLTAEYLSKMWKATGADQPAAAMRAVQGPSVFVYRFDWDEEPTMLGAQLSVMLGAAHGFEIPFVFGHFDLGREGNVIFTDENEPGRVALSTQMMAYWAQFAASGSPGRGRNGDLFAWTAWDNADGAKFVVFDTPANGAVRMSNAALTPASVVAAVGADPRLATPLEKCGVYRELANRSRGFTRQEYAEKPECAAYPYGQYPWGS
jgi:para-nitrobenzyl esterase